MIKIRVVSDDHKPEHKHKEEAHHRKHSWLEILGWSEDPFTHFSAKPAKQFLVGRETAKEALKKTFLLGHGSYGVILGPAGSGKTLLLDWLVTELEEKTDSFKVLRIAANTTEEEFVTTLTNPYSGFLRTYRGETPEELAEYLKKREERTLVISIDQAEYCEAFLPSLKALLGNGNTQVLMAGERVPPLKDPNVTVKLGLLEPAEAVELVRKRIEAVGGKGVAPFTTDELAELWMSAAGFLPSYFAACKQLAVHHAQSPKSTIEAELLAGDGYQTTAEDAQPLERKQVHHDDLITSLAEQKK